MDKKKKEKPDRSGKPVSMVFFIVFWAIAIGAAFIFGGKDLAMGVSLAAVISCILWVSSINSRYSGKIVRFEIKTYRDKDNFPREIRKAVLELDNGKTKKIGFMPDWKVGDQVVKARGETAPKVV
ncbi:MAG: hypothetical protein KKF44_07955, partial [Nanoarchaeota archaeon]|nr:hypothetical protein [Nanoarchaeota archaeon]